MKENNRLTLYLAILLSLIVITVCMFLFDVTVLLNISNAVTMFMIVSISLGIILVFHQKISAACRLKLLERKNRNEGQSISEN
ncbi:MAG: hypothetical protein WCR96_05915 [Candidatus Methanomethylophilaceae archaeon]|jgi:predicted membrane chloride channel (bestrophin family)